ncbi:MAG: hypothetical protein ACLQVL_30315 [Terriglobia bacterium]
MRNSTASLTPRFSASRAVGEYTEQHYLPAAAFRERAAEQGAVDRTIANCEHNMKEIWAALRFGGVKVQTEGARHVFEAGVYLGRLDPNVLRVELYGDGINGNRQQMLRLRQLAGAAGGYVFSAAALVKADPETVVRWHLAGFRLRWCYLIHERGTRIETLSSTGVGAAT